MTEHAQLPAVQVDGDTPADTLATKAQAFSFGDAESVIDRRELSQYFEIWHNGRWYEPPLPMDRLCQVFNMSPHHRSAIALKVNLLVSAQLPTAQLSAADFERYTIDFLQMGNGYLEDVPNLRGGTAQAKHSPARHMRAPKDGGGYYFVGSGIGQEHRFPEGRIFHLQQPDVSQEIYGLPEWLPALQSGLLNEGATLFRRRYYLNGAHAGFVFHVSDPLADQATVDQLAQKLQSAKGVGNFKNIFMYIPNGKKDGVNIIPIADVAAKDEFAAVKNISRDDLLAAHRVPPQLIGIIPQNNGGFGDVGKALDTFFQIEIVPIMQRMLSVNAWFGREVLRFRNYSASDGSQITPDGQRIPADRGGATSI